MTTDVANRRRNHCREGFTLLEVTVALAILLMASLLIVRVSIWNLSERAQSDARQEALDAAENVLESARALDWKELNGEWEKAQLIPASVAERLPGGKLSVHVDPDPSRPRTKRVAVEVHWEPGEGGVVRTVRLIGLFSKRSSEASGEKPQ